MEAPNLKYIKELSGGDKAFEKSILDVFKKEFPEEVKEFYSSFEKKDFLQTANIVHKIKHKISILGLKEGLELASNFENHLKKEDVKLYSEFVKILDKIRVYLDNN